MNSIIPGKRGRGARGGAGGSATIIGSGGIAIGGDGGDDGTPHAADDFQEGYEAGYNARAERRVALGTPAYRQGYAYGAQQRMSERMQRARAEQVHRPLWPFIVFAVALVVLLTIGLVKSVRADTLADWQQVNEVCQGGTGATADEACGRRGAIAGHLRAAGWFQGEHGVWVSPENVVTFTRIVRSYDTIGRANTGMLDSVMRGMMTELRRALPPEAIFALWNGRAGQILATTPYAASGLMYGLPYLERMLSGKNDPRLRMVLRP